MTITSQAPELQRIIVLQPIRQHLIFAQKRLQDRNIPFQLAATSYLRINCAAMQVYQRLGLKPAPTLTSKTPYLTLIEQLIEHHPNWWLLCSVNDNGYLVSSDRYIQALLQPFTSFAEQLLEAPSIV